MTKILISNDDGYDAKGIVALYEAIRDLGEVVVVAPDKNRSGASNSLTLEHALSIRGASNGFFAVNGTPTDCVHLACTGFLDFRPDIVISGINNGQNMANDTLYSGTVAAAMEGYLNGIPAIAFSQVDRDWVELTAAAKMARLCVEKMLSLKLSSPELWNVNIPNLSFEQLQSNGFEVTRLGRRKPAQQMHMVTTPRGETQYWIGAAGEVQNDDDGTDFNAVKHGRTSVTPLQTDLSDVDAISTVAQYFGRF